MFTLTVFSIVHFVGVVTVSKKLATEIVVPAIKGVKDGIREGKAEARRQKIKVLK